MDTIKNILISVAVVAVWVFGAHIFAPQQAAVVDQTLGASASQVQQVLWQFASGVSLDSRNSNGGAGSVIFTRSGTIAAGSNQGNWKNDTGRTVYVDYADVAFTGGVASSTMRVSVATSTAATIANNYAQPFGGLIDNAALSTSTPIRAAIFNSDVSAGTNAKGTVVVNDGEYVNFFFRVDNPNPCTGSVCEAATSSARGFTNVNWFLQAHFRP